MLQFDFVAPRSLDEAIHQLHERDAAGKVLAGGTDLLLQLKAHTLNPSFLLDLSRISELSRLEYLPGKGLWIGSMVRLRTIQQSKIVSDHSQIVIDGAMLVGSVQIRNLATIGGNLCNAAPSADVAPPLIAAGAYAEILGPGGHRSIALEDFFTGPRRTVLVSGEILLGVRIPDSDAPTGGHYLRHTPRQEMDIAVVGVGATVTLDRTRCQSARIVLGAVAPTPIRAKLAERSLIGQELSLDVVREAARIAADEARPIDDVRGSATYRRHLVEVLTQRAVSIAWNRCQEYRATTSEGSVA